MNGLPDIIDLHLKVLFIGYNPGLKSAEIGHHYAGASNNFWKLLYESGLTPYRFKPEEDRKLLALGYGSTNIIARPTRGAAELTAAEYLAGAGLLREVLERYKPAIACYVGVGIYKKFSRKKAVHGGLQQDSVVDGVRDYVCPSPSGLNRMPYREQLECFTELRRLVEGI